MNLQAAAFSVVLLLVTLLKDAMACTCFPTHAQQQFCRSEIVLVATVKAEENVYQNSLVKAPNPNSPDDPYARMPVERKYKVRVHRYFKGQTALGKIGKALKYIHTSGSDAACGAFLTKGKTYLITGYVQRNKEVWTSMCHWIQDYKTITRQQMKGLKFHYRRNCQCEVTFCSGSYCTEPGPRECRWRPRMWSQDCFQERGFCMLNNVNKCQWKRSRVLKQCLRDTNVVFPWKTVRKPPREVAPDPGDNSPGFGIPEEFDPSSADRSPGYGANSPGSHSPGYGSNSPGYNSPGYGQKSEQKLPDGLVEP